MLSELGPRASAAARSPDFGTPLVSVITTCKGRLAHLQVTLPLMLAQRCDFPFEVLVVDYGCPQGTWAWCCELACQRLVAVKVCDDTNIFHRSRARNCGAVAARGRLLTFIDADIRPLEEWLAQAVTPIRGSSMAWSVVSQLKNGWDCGGTWLVTADLFHRVRGYDEQLQGWGEEDADLYRRCAAVSTGMTFPAHLLHPIRHGHDERVAHHNEKSIVRSQDQNGMYLRGRKGLVNPSGYGIGTIDVFRGSGLLPVNSTWVFRPRAMPPLRRSVRGETAQSTPAHSDCGV